MDAETTSPRIAPLEPPYEPAVAEMLARWMPPGSELEPLRLFRTLAVHDDLAARMRPLGAGILGHGRLAPRLRELVVLRTCARAGAEYEWGVHAVAFAPALGLTGAHLAATVHAPADDPVWSAGEAAVLALADELHDTGGVSDATWAALAADLAPDELLELVVVAGWYRTIAYVVNAAGVQPEPWAARFPPAG